jgi:hypothetical protein
MPRKYSEPYVDKLLEGTDFGDLVGLSQCLCSSRQFIVSSQNYGLPQSAFVFVETLRWFAQAIRSGVWTYYESTQPLHQTSTRAALKAHAPKDFAVWYSRGMADWEDEEKIPAVDQWMEANESTANEWLRVHANTHRHLVLELTA